MEQIVRWSSLRSLFAANPNVLVIFALLLMASRTSPTERHGAERDNDGPDVSPSQELEPEGLCNIEGGSCDANPTRWYTFEGYDAFPGDNAYIWSSASGLLLHDSLVESGDDAHSQPHVPISNSPSPPKCQQACERMGFSGFIWFDKACYFRAHAKELLIEGRQHVPGAILYVLNRSSRGDYRGRHLGSSRYRQREEGMAMRGLSTNGADETTFLVFSSIGNRGLEALENHWLAHTHEKLFDLVLVFYSSTARNPVFEQLRQLATRTPGITLVVRKGYKWPNFKWWLDRNEDTISKYSQVWVADDDLLMSTRAINRMFLTMAANPGIRIASPAFSSSSAGLWRYHDRVNPHFTLRYTNFVECLGPVLSAQVLQDDLFRRCLAATRTGYYLDNAFYAIAGGHSRGMAILDTSVCIHPNRPASEKEMYTELSEEEHTQDFRFFEEQGIPREVYWFREPEYFGGQRRPHVPVHLRDEQLGMAPVEIHNRILRAMFPSRFGPNANFQLDWREQRILRELSKTNS
eukprot:CAMPEP_0184502146 /NCGR_PEP_ID=MMETSP0113_2-20130426/49460_1 /TAXON_ID=91329 /ORGANISM="Norrisiella sphaerica, Strain BC52" /LENGTH=519 /DNA_ID=CAMNT_0026891163 /DNA_START=128 /DNA_END=1687 /DNA_ORIENTATION=+